MKKKVKRTARKGLFNNKSAAKATKKLSQREEVAKQGTTADTDNADFSQESVTATERIGKSILVDVGLGPPRSCPGNTTSPSSRPIYGFTSTNLTELNGCKKGEIK